MNGKVADRTYSEAEVREILRRAVERDVERSEQLGRDNLVAAAGEMGIAASTVEGAIAEFETEQTLARELETLARERRQSFFSSLLTWGIVNAGLFGISFVGDGGGWFLYPLIAWGMALMLAHRRFFFPDPAKDRVKAQKRLARRNKEEARRQGVARRRASGWQLEEAIERGVESLLSGAAEHLKEAVHGRQQPPQGARNAEPAPRAEEHEADSPPAASRPPRQRRL